MRWRLRETEVRPPTLSRGLVALSLSRSTVNSSLTMVDYREVIGSVTAPSSGANSSPLPPILTTPSKLASSRCPSSNIRLLTHPHSPAMLTAAQVRAPKLVQAQISCLRRCRRRR
jgi:hypothetical protein